MPKRLITAPRTSALQHPGPLLAEHGANPCVGASESREAGWTRGGGKALRESAKGAKARQKEFRPFRVAKPASWSEPRAESRKRVSVWQLGRLDACLVSHQRP